MNQAYIHLALNHIPLIGLFIGLLILIMGYVVKNNVVKNTALGVFVFAAVFAVPTFLTGEGAEEVVENLSGVLESNIETHEDLATGFIWLICGLGIFALLTLVAQWKQKSFSKQLYWMTLVLAIVAMAFAKQVGTSGGEIRHTEINSKSTIETPAGTDGTPEENDKDQD